MNEDDWFAVFMKFVGAAAFTTAIAIWLTVLLGLLVLSHFLVSLW